MKKFIIILIAIVAVVTVFHFWDRAQNKLLDFNVLGRINLLADPKNEVFTPGPLRGTQSAPNALLTAEGVVNWTNQQRNTNNLPSLTVNSKLSQAAALKVKDMFDKQYFEHISPDNKGPSDLAKKVGYDYIIIGENLALGNFKDDQTLVEAWMNSPGHRANILNNKFLEIGVAVGKGTFEGNQTWLAVQEFGKPASACPQVNMLLKNQINGELAESDTLEAQIKQRKAELESLNPQTKEEVNNYNQKVKEYNDLIRIYNNKIDILKNTQTEYNNQVRLYNLCLGS